MTYSEPGGTQHISIHALREESDSGGFLCAIISPIFLSTPSARRATENGLRTSSWPHISIHALREEGDVTEIKQGEYLGISIHALREEGDFANFDAVEFHCLFLSTPSARRATPPSRIWLWNWSNFYPRPPRGGRHHRCRFPRGVVGISIHALREEGDPRPHLSYDEAEISIHALREEGDLFFLLIVQIVIISIHALREEGDRFFGLNGGADRYFYPRPPRGGRRLDFPALCKAGTISIHALREEGDKCGLEM